MKAYRQR
jgi:hypothetical protein